LLSDLCFESQCAVSCFAIVYFFCIFIFQLRDMTKTVRSPSTYEQSTDQVSTNQAMTHGCLLALVVYLVPAECFNPYVYM